MENLEASAKATFEIWWTGLCELLTCPPIQASQKS